MKYIRYCLLLQLLLGTLMVQVQAQAQVEVEVEVIELQHRQANEMIGQLTTLYPGPDTVFSPDGQRLMVKADPMVITEVRDLIDRLDVAPAQMRITIRRQQQSLGRGQNTISTAHSQNEQSIVVLDGETARIESGSLRRVTRAAQSGDIIALIAEDTPMTEGFLVQPRALGSSQVELRVVSFNTSPSRHRAQGSDSNTAALVTLRRAGPGEWVLLGSHSEDSVSERSGRVLSTASARAENQRWSIKVDILP